MKKIIVCILSALLFLYTGVFSAQAEEKKQLGWTLDHIYVTFNDETKDVLDEVMELQSNMQEPLYFNVDYEGYGTPVIFALVQLKDKAHKELYRGPEQQFSIMADVLEPDVPLYLQVIMEEDGRVLGVEQLGIRVNKNRILGAVPDDLGAEFGTGLKLDMDYLLPGMQLSALPFLIPVTVRTYSDGTIRMGLGINSTDADFWEKAATGQMEEAKLESDLKELFEGDPHNLDNVTKPQSMGVVFMFSGWAEGNMNNTEPVLGQFQLYIGTGFQIGGQYGIFTWNIALSGGATGQFDFRMVYSEEDSEYHFNADTFLAGVKGAVEAYGGVGCSLASVGVYGAGSVTYQEEMYPDPDIEHLILAGEVGLKAKLFGKVLACYRIIAGSHDFKFDPKEKKNEITGTTLSSEQIRQELLSAGYGDMKGVLTKGGENLKWHGDQVETPAVRNTWETDRDFAHLLAADIYPDNHVQIVNSGSSALPGMTMVFLGSDAKRKEGNRSSLMGAYYNIATQFVSDPVFLFDDGTADYDPYFYENTRGYEYLVWKNAVDEISADMTFAEIAAKTDIYFSAYHTGNIWDSPQRVTSLAGTGVFASGARVCADSEGNPLISYFTSDVKDPAGLGGKHEIFLAHLNEKNEWVSEKITEVTGNIISADCAQYGSWPALIVSYEEDDERHTVLIRNGETLFDKPGTSCGRFIEAGNNYSFATWYQEGRVYQRSENGTESPLTPERMIIPDMEYEIYGHIGMSPLMISGSVMHDGVTDAVCWFSNDGGASWQRSDLTRLNETALVTHFGAAFTDEDEPVIVYSVQNYTANVDLERIIEDPMSVPEDKTSGQVLAGTEDDRFTDGQSDLYISARRANAHLTFESGKTLNPGDLLPGKPVTFSLKVKNTGLYDIDHAVITCNGETAGELTETLKPWESTDVSATVTLPDHPKEIVSYTFEISSRDDMEAESRITVEADPGWFDVKTWHSFRFGEEQVRYQIKNHGYLDKKAHIVIRDEINDTVLEERDVTAESGWIFDSTYKAHNTLFVKDGCEDVTVYILDEGQTVDTPGISLNRISSVTPLPEIYDQPYDILEEGTALGGGDGGELSSILIAAGLAAGIAAVLLFVQGKKKRGKNETV